MEKTFHFMAGLPRSGSTVLAALLNQHPDVYASPQTDLLGLMYSIHSQVPDYQSYKAGLFHNGFESVLLSMPNSFYSDVKKPLVIDKHRSWGTPYNFTQLSPYLNPKGKVILTLRPILEVIASFIKVDNKSELISGRSGLADENLWSAKYREKTDAKVEYLMRANGEIDNSIYSIANLLKNYKDRIYVLWFNDLLSKPQKKLSEIYDFLELSNYENNFAQIVELDKHNDFLGYGIHGLHDIKQKLENPGTRPNDYLSNFSIEKYKGTLDFLGF